MTSTTSDGNAVFAGCTSMLPSSSSTTVGVRQDPGQNTQVTGVVTMWAQPITVELRASDSSLFVPSTTSPGASTDAQPTSTTSQSSGTAASSTESRSSGLSTGAGIGVGVGVGVGGLAMFAALGLWLLRRHRKNKTLPTAPYDWPRPYITAQPRIKQEYPSELSADGARKPIMYELHG